MALKEEHYQSSNLINFRQAQIKRAETLQSLGSLRDAKASLERQLIEDKGDLTDQDKHDDPSTDQFARRGLEKGAMEAPNTKSLDFLSDFEARRAEFNWFGSRFDEIENRLSLLSERMASLSLTPRTLLISEDSAASRSKTVGPSPANRTAHPSAPHVTQPIGRVDESATAHCDTGSIDRPRDADESANSFIRSKPTTIPTLNSSKQLDSLRSRYLLSTHSILVGLGRSSLWAVRLTSMRVEKCRRSLLVFMQARGCTGQIDQGNARILAFLKGGFTLKALLGLTSVGIIILGFHFVLASRQTEGSPQTTRATVNRSEESRRNISSPVAAGIAQQPARAATRVNSLQTSMSLLDPQPLYRPLVIESEPPRIEKAVPEPILAQSNVTAAGATDRDKAAEVVGPSVGNELPMPPQDEARALEQLAENNDANAQYAYATDLFKRGEIKSAVGWLEKSARQGAIKAQLELGILYLKGSGVQRNIGAARKWLETAAENGDALAMHNLAVLHCEGATPNYAAANDWFRRAAERGVAESQFNLGVAYAQGLGLEKDPIQAYAWLTVAAANGEIKAEGQRRKIAKLLNREELTEAKTLAQSFKLLSAPE